jgi:hypothetical protein
LKYEIGLQLWETWMAVVEEAAAVVVMMIMIMTTTSVGPGKY